MVRDEVDLIQELSWSGVALLGFFRLFKLHMLVVVLVDDEIHILLSVLLVLPHGDLVHSFVLIHQAVDAVSLLVGVVALIWIWDVDCLDVGPTKFL